MGIEENKKEIQNLFHEIAKGERSIDAEFREKFYGLKYEYDVNIKLKSIGGTCPGQHKVGDEWVMKGAEDLWRTPNMCFFAFSAMYPSVLMLMYGGSFPWEPDSEVVLVPCPDSRNDVVFELKRIEQD